MRLSYASAHVILLLLPLLLRLLLLLPLPLPSSSSSFSASRMTRFGRTGGSTFPFSVERPVLPQRMW